MSIEAAPVKRPSAFALRGGLAAGIVAVSTAAVLIRLAQAPSLVVAAWRLTLASAVLVPAELLRTRRLPEGRDLRACGVAGFFLALHFASWIASLRYTSVASSVVLVTINPIFVGMLSRWVLGERLERRTIWGIGAGVSGAVLVGWGDFGSGTAPLLGDALALCGALAASAYLIAGRKLRRRLDLGSYATWVYAWAAAFLLAGALALGLPLYPYPASTYWALAGLALIPQLIGHTALNWALAHLSAATVSVVILGEPLGASLLAYLVLGERAQPALDRAKSWLSVNNTAVMAVLFLVFGFTLLGKGLGGLL
jgi:drug/metabolite transporter (DMT)-like permease